MCLLRLVIEFLWEVLWGIGGGRFGELLGGGGWEKIWGDVRRLWREVNEVVGGFDEMDVVLDDEERMWGSDEGTERSEEFVDVMEMEGSCGLVEEEDGRVWVLDSEEVGEF